MEEISLDEKWSFSMDRLKGLDNRIEEPGPLPFKAIGGMPSDPASKELISLWRNEYFCWPDTVMKKPHLFEYWGTSFSESIVIDEKKWFLNVLAMSTKLIISRWFGRCKRETILDASWQWDLNQRNKFDLEPYTAEKGVARALRWWVSEAHFNFTKISTKQKRITSSKAFAFGWSKFPPKRGI